MLKVYTYSKCDSCRRAVKFLRQRGVQFTELPIRETPPPPDEIAAMLQAIQPASKVFNTSGADYRQLGLSASLPNLSLQEIINLLASNGNLIKRPFVISDSIKLTGFNPDTWDKVF